MEDGGHLFVVDGDLRRISCDAWLLPTDFRFSITPLWHEALPAEALVETRIGDETKWLLQGHAWAGDFNGEVIPCRWDGMNGVYLARIGHSGGNPDVYVTAAMNFIERATLDLELNGRRPRLAINHLGSGRGGARQVRGGVLERLVNALQDAMNAGTVAADVILVSWGEKDEAAAQYLRLVGREASLRSSKVWHFANDNERIHRTAQDLAHHFKAGNACIFMGAGTSAGAGLPTWSGLLEEILTEVTDPDVRAHFVETDDNLQRASILRDALTTDVFAGAISNRLKADKYSLLHGLLSSLPCREYITTNVDTLFEEASSTKNRGLTILPALDDRQMVDRWLLKIHGCVSLPETLVFTDEDYRENMSTRRALFGVLQAMLLTRHMVFVGYSLSDPDFLEILSEVRAALPAGMTESARLGRKLGTVLTLYSGDGDTPPDDDRRDLLSLFDHLPLSAHTRQSASENDTSGAVRDLERFLDLVGMLASDRAGFLLDHRYEGLLTETEQKLAEALEPVTRLAQAMNGASGWEQVWELLRSLGANPETIGKDRPGILGAVPHVRGD